MNSKLIRTPSQYLQRDIYLISIYRYTDNLDIVLLTAKRLTLTVLRNKGK